MKNIIIVLADQHSNKFIGYNNLINVLKTPNIDSLIKNGVYFKNCYSSNPICMPSRVSIFSGLNCYEHGYYGNDGKNVNLPEYISDLKNNGYKTFYSGKVHLPEDYLIDKFDKFYSHETHNFNEELFNNTDIYQYYKDLKKNGIKCNHVNISSEHKKKCKDNCQKYKINYNQILEGYSCNVPLEYTSEMWSVNKLFEFIEKFIKQNDKFCAVLSFPRPHQITSPHKQFFSLYDNISILDLPINFNLPNVDTLVNKVLNNRFKNQDFLDNHLNNDYYNFCLSHFKGYLGAISQIDHIIGILLTFLKKNNINHLFVYTSDHGEYGCEWGLCEKKPALSHDCVPHVPLIFYNSEVLTQNIIKRIVSTCSIFPTILQYVLNRKYYKSLGTIFTNPKKEYNEDIAVTEFIFSRSVRYKQYRLYLYIGEIYKYTLFDLDNDIWELREINDDSIVKNIMEKLFIFYKIPIFDKNNSINDILNLFYNYVINFKIHYQNFLDKYKSTNNNINNNFIKNNNFYYIKSIVNCNKKKNNIIVPFFEKKISLKNIINNFDKNELLNLSTL